MFYANYILLWWASDVEQVDALRLGEFSQNLVDRSNPISDLVHRYLQIYFDHF